MQLCVCYSTSTSSVTVAIDLRTSLLAGNYRNWHYSVAFSDPKFLEVAKNSILRRISSQNSFAEKTEINIFFSAQKFFAGYY